MSMTSGPVPQSSLAKGRDQMSQASDSAVLSGSLSDIPVQPRPWLSSTGAPLAPLVSSVTAFQLGRQQVVRDIVSTVPLLFTDVAAVILACMFGAVAEVAFSQTELFSVFPVGLVSVSVVLFFQAFHGLYPACGVSSANEFGRCLRTSVVSVFVLAVAMLLKGPPLQFWLPFIGFAGSLSVLLCLGRPLVRRFLGQTIWWPQPVVIVGDCQKSHELYLKLKTCCHEGLRPVGLIVTGRRYWKTEQQHHGKVIGPLADLDEILKSGGICRLAIASRYDSTTVDYQRYRGIPHVMMPTGLEHHPVERARLVDDGSGLHLHCQSALTNPTSLFSKRLMDLFLVIITMPAWLPLMIVIAAWIKITDPGPVFYPQKRVGRFNKAFNALKFRSMVVDADQRLQQYLSENAAAQAEWDVTHKLKNDPRVTMIGQLLRKTSLDELPQLLNVLMGEMSLVGPRPIINCDQYDREYIDEHPEVFELYQMVRPGITGLWQISGRNHTTYKQRVYYDRLYLQNWTLSFDLYILWRTLKTAVLREGAY